MSDSLRPRGLQPPGSSVQGTPQAGTLEWVAISFSHSKLTFPWNVRIDPFFVCKQELGARQQTPRCPGRAFCSPAQGRSRSLSLFTPGTRTPGRRPSASCVVGFEVQPAEPPGPPLPSQIFHTWWLQFEERADHPLSILLGLTAFMVGPCATFTGGPLARTSHMLKCLSHPKKVNTVTITTCKTSPSILANIIILPYIYIFFHLFLLVGG